MVYISPVGRNWGPTVNWDDLGKLYAGFIIAWTMILMSGMAWLIWHRQLPSLRMRNIPLAITSVCFLHVYLLKICLAYTTNGHFLCAAEFWIMSIYLPFGIALFQANLVQLQSISAQQQKLLSLERQSSIPKAQPKLSGIKGLWTRWCRLSELQKTYTTIGFLMVIQVRQANRTEGATD